MLRELMSDLRRRDEMNPLGKGCFLDDLTLIILMAHNDMELAAFSVFIEQPAQMRKWWASQLPFDFFTLLRAIKAFANFRLAAIENELEKVVDLDNFEWIGLKAEERSSVPAPAETAD